MVDRGDVDALVEIALERFGRVDILVNNAGSNVPQSVESIVDEDWDRIMELNLSSCMRLTRAPVPQMKQRRWVLVIHISSVLGLAVKNK
jgi:NAD(P)-dependent dehydrogenase (short-subunit alcohol dehydrogenase family)